MAVQESAANDGEQAGEDGQEQHEAEVVEPTAISPPACPLLAKMYGEAAFEPAELVSGLPVSRIVAACWLGAGAEVCLIRHETYSRASRNDLEVIVVAGSIEAELEAGSPRRE